MTAEQLRAHLRIMGVGLFTYEMQGGSSTIVLWRVARMPLIPNAFCMAIDVTTHRAHEGHGLWRVGRLSSKIDNYIEHDFSDMADVLLERLPLPSLEQSVLNQLH